MTRPKDIWIYIVSFAIFASLSTAQAASKIGGGSFGFSCDVNTKECKCKGVETGADCEGMKKNCGTNRLMCWDNTTTGPMCVCSMARKKRLPSNVTPTLKEIAPQKKIAPPVGTIPQTGGVMELSGSDCRLNGGTVVTPGDDRCGKLGATYCRYKDGNAACLTEQ